MLPAVPDGFASRLAWFRHAIEGVLRDRQQLDHHKGLSKILELHSAISRAAMDAAAIDLDDEDLPPHSHTGGAFEHHHQHHHG